MILKSRIHNQYQNYQHLKDLDDLKVWTKTQKTEMT